jgi:hypothetical protein
MKLNAQSATMIAEIEITTLDVVARPTASAPPSALRPLLQEISVTSQPKTIDLTVLLRKRIGGIPSRIDWK